MTGKHSMYAPSSAHRWVKCPASVRLVSLRGIDPGSEAADEGTAAHYVLSQLLQGQPWGVAAPNGYPIDDDMVEGAALAVEAVAPHLPTIHSEARVAIPRISPECFGTVDMWSLGDDGVLRIWDYKYGWGIVEPEDNYQLIAYCSGVMSMLQMHDLELTVELGIIQPRPYHPAGRVRIWRVPATDLRPHLNHLEGAAREARVVESLHPPTYHTGGHCAGCPGRHDCPALQQSAALAVDLLADLMLPPEAPIEAKSRELVKLEEIAAVIEARRTGLAAEIEEKLKTGSPVPGWGLEEKRGRRGWAIPVDAVVAMGPAFGLDLSKPGAITPAQAKKLGLPPEVLAEVTTQPVRQGLCRVDNLKGIFGNGN